ncbi:MAG: hypothetical protein LIO79_09390 [Rikenellaceae bacterium]|nr:hypothetical protein [Rikenellaceae bacterium]
MEKDYTKEQEAIDQSDELNATVNQNEGSVKTPDPIEKDKIERTHPSDNELLDIEQGSEFIGIIPE